MFDYSQLPEQLSQAFADYDPSHKKEIADIALQCFRPFEDLNILIDLYGAHPEFFEEDELTHALCDHCNDNQINKLLKIALKNIEDSRNCLALLGYQSINTACERSVIEFISAHHKISFDEPIIEDNDGKELYLITHILLKSNDNEVAQLALTVYFESKDEEVYAERLNEFIDYILNHQKYRKAILRLIKFCGNANKDRVKNNPLRQTIKDILDIFSGFIEKLSEMLSEVDERAGWSHVDPANLTDDQQNTDDGDEEENALTKMSEYLLPFCMLIGFGLVEELDLIADEFKKLLRKIDAEIEPIPDEGWGVGDNPISEIEDVVISIEQLQTFKITADQLVEISQVGKLETLKTTVVQELLTKVQVMLARQLFSNIRKLLKTIHGMKECKQGFPTIKIDLNQYIEGLVKPFMEQSCLTQDDFKIVQNILKIIGCFEDITDIQADIQHRQYSGSRKHEWEKAPAEQKYVTAIKIEGVYQFIALPLIVQSAATDEHLSIIEKIELALLSSLFYHLKKEAWDSETCVELRRILEKINMIFAPYPNQSEYLKRYHEIEQKDYYAECLSEDSEAEHVEEFSRETIRVQNALLTSAEQMMKRGQVDALWTKDRKKLLEPTYKSKKSSKTKSSDFEISEFSSDYYDLTARAEIHHDQDIPVAVMNDLSLLNEHAIRERLNLETLKEIDTKFYVAQYRGAHFNQDTWTQRGRKEYRKSGKPHEPIYSPAVFKKANVKLTTDVATLSQAELRQLERQGALLKHQIDCLDRTGSLCSNLSNKVFDETYETASDALQDFYTKKYTEHKHICQEINDNKKTQTLMQDPLRVAMLHTVGGENYLNSTGDTPCHALRYAFGMKTYAFQSRLEPRWRRTGQLERPYVGKVYTMLFNLSSYLQANPRHLVSLHHHRGVVIDARKLAEREASFPAYISKEHIIEQIVIRFPNFNQKDYNPYYEHKYGMSEELYTHFREHLLSSAPGSFERLKIEYLIIEHICAYHEACLIEDARQIAKRKGGWLIYRDRTGGFSLVPPRLMPKTKSDADQALCSRQEKELKERKQQKPDGWLHKLMQDKRVLPGDSYRLVLKRLMPALEAHMTDKVLNQAGLVIPEGDWIKHIISGARAGFTGYVKEYFQVAINEFLRIAKNANIKIIIQSFLFTKDFVINAEGQEQVWSMLYLGGDGFHGIVAKDWVPEDSLVALQTAARLDIDSDEDHEGHVDDVVSTTQQVAVELSKDDSAATIELPLHSKRSADKEDNSDKTTMRTSKKVKPTQDGVSAAFFKPTGDDKQAQVTKRLAEEGILDKKTVDSLKKAKSTKQSSLLGFLKKKP